MHRPAGPPVERRVADALFEGPEVRLIVPLRPAIKWREAYLIPAAGVCYRLRELRTE